MSLRRRIITDIMIWICLLMFMGVSMPSRLPVVVLILPFALLFAGCYGLWGVLQEIRVRYFAGSKPSNRLGITISLSAVLLLILQSLGQLALRDVITVIAIVCIGYLYVARLTVVKRGDG